MNRLYAKLAALLPAALILLYSGTYSLHAQTLKGTILGAITDASGAVIPGAQIVLTETAQNLSRTAQTNEAGLYVFANLDPGPYRVEVEQEGFNRAVRSNVILNPNTTVRVNLELTPGVVTEVIDVTGTAPLLQTDRADTGGQIESQQVQTLPLGYNRNYQSLLNTVPGAQRSFRPHSRFYNSQDHLSVRVNGQGRHSNNFQIEGIENKIDNGNLTALVPPAEAIQTVDMSTSNFDPEFGQAAGAVINVTLRSGTNEVHGSLFHFHRNSATASREAFASSLPRAIYNQFGGTLGGPIVRDKMFIFGDYQGSRDLLGENNRFSIPTEAFRQGDLSAGGRPVYDPLTGNADGTGRTPFANMQIPDARISPISKQLMSFLPATTAPGTSINWEGNTVSTKDINAFDVKYDWVISDNDRFMFRYSYQKAVVFDPGLFGPEGGIYGGPRNTGFQGSGPARTQSPGVSWSHIFSPTLLTEARFGIVRNRNDALNLDTGSNISEQIGIKGVNLGDYWTSGLTEIRIPDITGNTPLLGYSGSLPWARSVTFFGVVNNYTWTKQNHIFRWGMDIRRERNDLLQTEAPRGRFTFEDGQTALRDGPASGFGNSMASFLLDRPHLVQRGFPYLFPARRAIVYNFYFQDKWQVGPKLTVDLGLRYENEPGQTPRHPAGFSNYNLTNNTLELAGLGEIPMDLGVLRHHGFGPRLGIAYRMNEKTVIRTGYGVSYRPRNSANQQYPTEISDNFNALSAFTPAVGRGVELGMGTTGIPVPIPLDIPANGIIVNPPLSNSFSYRQPDNPKAYVQSWNLAIQRALPGDFAFEAAYIGNHAVNTSSNVNLNAGQVPGLGSGGQIFNGLFGKTAGVNMHHGLHSSYNALQVKLNRPFQNGFMLTTAYTFSKAIDFCTDNCSAPVHALNYRHLNRGRSNTDFTHMFVQSYMYELPFGPGKSRLQSGPASWILGGWQVNGFLTLQSGAPINITVSSASLNMPGNTNRPDQIVTGEPAILGNIGPGQKFFDVTAFAQPGPARFGTVGRNIMQGPGTVNLDASLFKNFNIREGMRLQLRIESFNFTNTPSFVNPNGNFSAATFGEVTSTSPELSDPQARRFQFGLKLIF